MKRVSNRLVDERNVDSAKDCRGWISLGAQFGDFFVDGIKKPFRAVGRDATLGLSTAQRSAIMFSQANFKCPVVAARVTVFCQTFINSGIGNSASVQHDYSCSHESSCQHRTTAACRVRQLNLNG
jgi:hypothetical protein